MADLAGRDRGTRRRPEPVRLTLAGFIDGIASHLRSFGTAAGDMVADHVRELAGEVRQLGAHSIAEFEARRDALLSREPEAAAVSDPRWSDEPVGW